MSEVFNDSSLWHPRTTESPPRSASSYSGVRREKRQQAQTFACQHCGRVVSRLVFLCGCTYECELAAASFDAHRYDYVYTKIMTECTDMPQIAPPVADMLTADEYWESAVDDLYSADSDMADSLRQRLRSNRVDDSEISKRRR